MTMTLMEAIYKVRSALDEPAEPSLPNVSVNVFPKMYTDTELTEWINDGLRDVSRRAEDLVTNAQASIPIPAAVINQFTGAVPTFPLQTDVIRLTRVEFVPVQQTNQIYRVEPSTQNEMDQIWGTYQQNTSTYPRWYVLLGYPGGTGPNLFQIQLYPCSSQSGNLNVYYYRLPVYILDPVANPSQYNVTLDIIVGWEDVVVDFAVYNAFKKQRNPDWAQRKAEYEEKVAQMIDVTRKFHDQQSYVSYGTNMLPSWLVGGGEW